jgi:hypothetical protein
MWDTKALELVDSFESGFGVAATRFTAYEMPPWAYVRAFLAKIVADRVAGTSYHAGAKRSGGRLSQIAYLARTLSKVPRSMTPRESQVLIFGSGAANIETPRGYHNRLVDHLARAANALVFEDSYAQKYLSPRTLRGVLYHDPIRALAAIGSRFRALPKRDADVIGDLMRCASSYFKELLQPADIATLTGTLVQVARRMPFWHSLYQRILEKTQPRVLLIEDACYGMNTHLIAWAHTRGIVTAEYQHGQTYAQHPAYRMSAALHTTEWVKFLPQHYLAWGEYWLRPLRLPIKGHVIGFPDLTERGRALKGVFERTQLLFVSSGMDLAVYQSILEQLGAAGRGRLRLLFRPHPIERGGAQEKYSELLCRYGWELDADLDPYTSFAKSALVIGDVSTAMFEALEFSCAVVLIDAPLTRELMPEEVFSFASRFDDLDALLAAGQKAVAAREKLWEDDWEDRFRRFLADCSVEQSEPHRARLSLS